MKRMFIATLLLSVNLLSFCQSKKHLDKKAIEVNQNDTVPPYLRTKKLPDFKILQAVSKKDSVWYANTDLPANKPTVIIYFSPECGHCHHEMKEILKNMDSLKNATFVFASFFNLDSIKGFAEKYSITKYPNIRMGRDTKYFLPVYFSVKFTPFVALYDTKQNFVKSYDQGADMHELIQLINAMPVDNVFDKKGKKKIVVN